MASVLRRGNEQVAINYLHADGQWHWPDRSISQAITAERTRIWTPEETRAFTAGVTKLKAAMGPEWQGELLEITTMAAPLSAPATAAHGGTSAAPSVQPQPRRAAEVRKAAEQKARRRDPQQAPDTAQHQRHEPPRQPDGPMLR